MAPTGTAARAGSLPWTRLEPLGVYLNDHLAGSTSGVELSKRLARAHGGARGNELGRIADEVEEDRSTLVSIMRRLGMPVRRYKVIGGWVVEKVARVKLNGRIAVRSPLSTVIELETMTLGVEGKAAVWRVLRGMAERDSRLDARLLDNLLARAQRQVEGLERLRNEAAVEVFG